MQKLALILFVANLSLTISFGQVASPNRVPLVTSAKSEKVKKLIAASGGVVARTNLLLQLRQALPQVSEEFWTEFEKEFSSEALFNICASIYLRHLTDEDLDGLIAFYESPLGLKLQSKAPEISKEIFSTSFELGKQVGQRIEARLGTTNGNNQKPVERQEPNSTERKFSFATLTEEQKGRLLSNRGYDPEHYTVDAAGYIRERPTAPPPPAPVAALPPNVRFIIVVRGSQGTAFYYSEKEPKPYGSGFKFVTWPVGFEMVTSGDVTITKVGGN